MVRLALLLLLIVSVAVGQMTFSDGWEKRAAALKNQQGSADVEIHQCDAIFTEGLKRLHREMVELYGQFKSCVEENPLKKNPFGLFRHPYELNKVEES